MIYMRWTPYPVVPIKTVSFRAPRSSTQNLLHIYFMFNMIICHYLHWINRPNCENALSASASASVSVIAGNLKIKWSKKKNSKIKTKTK